MPLPVVSLVKNPVLSMLISDRCSCATPGRVRASTKPAIAIAARLVTKLSNCIQPSPLKSLRDSFTTICSSCLTTTLNVHCSHDQDFLECEAMPRNPPHNRLTVLSRISSLRKASAMPKVAREQVHQKAAITGLLGKCDCVES